MAPVPRTSHGLERPTKRARLALGGSSSGESSDSEAPNGTDESKAGASNAPGFTVNEDYARRFEHNKKREELQRLQEKHGRMDTADGRSLRRHGFGGGTDDESGSDGSSTSEEEDEGDLATENLDAEIAATLKAIKHKDPRVYDEKFTFYSAAPADERPGQEGDAKNGKPMYLRDYHRKNLLEGHVGGEQEDDGPEPPSYAQEQNELKRRIVGQMHEAAETDSDEDSEAEQEDDFLVAKKGDVNGKSEVKKGARKAMADEILAEADKDPEKYLSNLMASRACVATERSQPQPFESDDEEEDQRIEAFEQAYNLRFEDPSGSNEKLMSHARDAASRYSVRKDEPTGRRKVRETEREKKEAAKREATHEKARLRILKIEQLEDKFKKIKEAAGLRGQDVSEEDWTKFLEDGWDDARWEEQMTARFGDAYYAERERDDQGSEPEDSHKSGKKVRKPKWDDIIDIKDLVPDFREDEAADGPAFTLSDDEPVEASHEQAATSKTKKEKKDAKQERQERKKLARKERRKIEELADQSLETEPIAYSLPGKQPTQFRYRETSPVTYGLTARDILMASDTQLNQYAGLKKLAAFRDAEKKQKDRKRLGKKARLRQWRKETFGDEQGPPAMPQPSVGPAEGPRDDTRLMESAEGVMAEGKRKRKRSKKAKGKSTA